MAQSKPHVKALFVHTENEESERIFSILKKSRRAAFEVKHATTLKESLFYLKTETWDIVLANLDLSDSSPNDTFGKLHTSFPDTPILLLIDSEVETQALKAMEEGAQEYVITKLVTPRAMIRAVFYVIEKLTNERALELERKLLHNLMENIPDRIFFKDNKSRFIRVNKALSIFHGYKSTEEAIGKTDFDYFSSEHAQQAFDDEQEILRTGKPLINKIEKETYHNKETSWCLTNKIPLLDDNGNITGTFGISHDITKLMNMEVALEKEQKRLKHLTQQLQDKNSQLEEDLMMAREIQQAFIPDGPLELKTKDNALIKLLPYYKPATSVGGDFFSFIPLKDNMAGVFLCDVMGHGLRAALVTGIVRGLVEKFKTYAKKPGVFMTQLNRELRNIFANHPNPTLVSALYMVVNPEEQLVHIAHAGHPDPVLIDPNNREVCVMELPKEEKGPVMGILEDIKYHTATFPFIPGHSILTFTDGVFEATNDHEKEFGIQGLLNSLKKNCALGTDKVFDSLLKDLQAFTHASDFEDDVCLVAVNYTS
ncbi:MAG: SpoIIE family protein phosphatase [Verrucomicrobiota bacterium]